jgi:hypothetical protein
MLLVLLGGLIVALLQVRPPVAGPLDPNDTGPFGAHALVALLQQRRPRRAAPPWSSPARRNCPAANSPNWPASRPGCCWWPRATTPSPPLPRR